MISSKYINIIGIVLVCIALLPCLAGVVFHEQITDFSGNSAVKMEYETALFDTDKIMEVDISIDEEDWNDLLDNAIKEEYYKCDVKINGKDFYSVDLRAKGNTSLSSIANEPDNNRYSFKIEFDKFAEGQRKSVNGKAGNNRMMPGGMGERRFGEGEAPPWGEGMPPDAGFPGEGMNGGMNGRFFGNEQTVSDTPEGFIGFVKEYQTPLISVGLLAGAFVFVIFYKRKNY